MFKLLGKVYSLLSKDQKKAYFKLQILIFLMGLSEMAGVLSISPFMTLISNPNIINQPSVLSSIYHYFEFTQFSSFLIFVGTSALIVLAVSAIVSIYTTWFLAMFANKVGVEFGEKLYESYLTENWLFHTTNNSAYLTQKIAVESNRFTTMVLVAIVRLNAKLVIIMMLSLLIFSLSSIIAVSALLLFGMAYYCLFRIVRSKLTRNSQLITKANQERFLLMSEAFGAIKDVLLLNKQQEFISRFENFSSKLAKATGSNQALVEVPRFFMEMVTFSAIILLILYLFNLNEGDVSVILPLLSIYALAGFKMLPAFQQIYRSIGQIKGNLTAFEIIKDDLAGFEKKIIPTGKQSFDIKFGIELKNVDFKYSGKDKNIVNNLNITIPVLKTVGLVGASGCGKSTTLDIILGLLKPNKGQVLIDGQPLENERVCDWQKNIGYVSQHIYLSDRTLIENIAFGVRKEDINVQRVKTCLQKAHLLNVVDELPDGLATTIGEQGIQLSGGQRQRLGIARALYHDPNILFFDEATSALDGVTEKVIMDALEDFSGQKTIFLIAHRLKTVKNCDVIYVMNEGEIVGEGTFEELVSNNNYFKQLAKYT